MNVKISIELPEHQLAFAERKVREGGYASVSEVITESLRDSMLSEHDGKDTNDPVTAIADEIRRRLQTPDDQWIEMDENDDLFERLEERLQRKFGAANK